MAHHTTHLLAVVPAQCPLASIVHARPPAGTPPLNTFAQTALDLHNTYRSRHRAGNLVWNASLAASSQSWANSCVWAHSGGNYGENLVG